jgi:hypothetical protein
VADLLQRIGGFAPELVAPVAPARDPTVTATADDSHPMEQAETVPEHRIPSADSRWVVDLEECQIAEPALNEQIRHARAHPPPRGGLKAWCASPRSMGGARDFPFFRTISSWLPALVETPAGARPRRRL